MFIKCSLSYARKEGETLHTSTTLCLLTSFHCWEEERQRFNLDMFTTISTGGAYTVKYFSSFPLLDILFCYYYCFYPGTKTLFNKQNRASFPVYIHTCLNLYTCAQSQAILVEFAPQINVSPEQDSLPIIYAKIFSN